MNLVPPPRSPVRFRPAAAVLTLMTALAVAAFAAPGAAPKKPSASSKKLATSDSLFTDQAVPQIRIDASEAALAKLREYQWKFGPQTERESVQVTVREGQTTYTNVALHLKGAAGSFQSVDQKPALTLNFDRFAPGQSFHGLNKLSLNNSVQDPASSVKSSAGSCSSKRAFPSHAPAMPAWSSTGATWAFTC